MSINSQIEMTYDSFHLDSLAMLADQIGVFWSYSAFCQNISVIFKVFRYNNDWHFEIDHFWLNRTDWQLNVNVSLGLASQFWEIEKRLKLGKLEIFNRRNKACPSKTKELFKFFFCIYISWQFLLQYYYSDHHNHNHITIIS